MKSAKSADGSKRGCNRNLDPHHRKELASMATVTNITTTPRSPVAALLAAILLGSSPIVALLIGSAL